MLEETLTLTSSWWFRIVVFVGAAVWFDLRRGRGLPETAIVVALAYAVSSAFSTVLKYVVDRERPADLALVDLPTTPSFPSGHATTAFAAAVALSLLVPRAAWWALPAAAVVAYSRVYLGVHYWSDIVAGAILGATVGWWLVTASRTFTARRARA